METDPRYHSGWSESRHYRTLVRRLHIDVPLFIGLLLLSLTGLVILYSAGGQDSDVIIKQGSRLTIACVLMLVVAQINPRHYASWAPWFAGAGLLLLATVLVVGDIGKGAQRWLDLGFMRFQPSEMMKLALPMTVAWYLADRPLPPSARHLFIACALVIIPVLLIARQPDLGTAILVAASGAFVLLLAGISWRLITALGVLIGASIPVIWYLMHDYQRNRVWMLLDPESDPLGAGYHIIQSKIAIGSGGIFGKGWLNGTQAHLEFLPERSTDFIFAVFAEEFGLFGILLLLTLYLFIVLRGLLIATQAQDTFTRLLSGSLVLTFSVYVFVNIGMVVGLLPVVGIPLPLISFGGTAMVTHLVAFGILMSIHTHRKLLPT
ncbi:MAG: rod shape determining protein RodA [Gammaproteobacteria bacterium]|nr:MAG: rod shape determining protein RodA [Gammaproteobacteria bacterium]TND06326.1 MAG: rod shape determining protein RodA [Gammaproteobacteria bacterium]